MGEASKDALRVGFERGIKLTFHGARVRCDAGLFAYRDLDEAAGLTESAADELLDFRTGANTQHTMTALLRQSIYSRLAGYEDVHDAKRRSVDPVVRHVVGGRAGDRGAAGGVVPPGGTLRDRRAGRIRQPRRVEEHARPMGGPDSATLPGLPWKN